MVDMRLTLARSWQFGLEMVLVGRTTGKRGLYQMLLWMRPGLG